MEILVLVIFLTFIVAVLGNLTNPRNDQLELENQAYRIVLASIQRNNGNEDKDNVAGLLLFLLFVMLVVLLIAAV